MLYACTMVKGLFIVPCMAFRGCTKGLHRSTKLNLFSVALIRVVVPDYIWSAENGGDLGFAQCHLVWTGLPDLGLPGPKISFYNLSKNIAENL